MQLFTLNFCFALCIVFLIECKAVRTLHYSVFALVQKECKPLCTECNHFALQCKGVQKGVQALERLSA